MKMPLNFNFPEKERPVAQALLIFFTTSLLISGCATLKISQLGNGLDANGGALYLASSEEQRARAAGFLAQHPELSDELKIQYLLACIQDSQYPLVRNGVTYSGPQAMQWLRWKRTHPQYKDNPIRTPDDFIERVADGSRNTGLPYEVILPDGHRERLKNLLRNELVSLEADRLGKVSGEKSATARPGG